MKEKYKIFNDYFKTFNYKDKRNLNKFHHTYRVVEFCQNIALSLNLNESDVKLAMICGLVHDIARFVQIDKYNTFSANESFDHGDMGYEILRKDDFVLNFVEEKYKDIVLYSVKYHNKKYIDDKLSERELLFIKISRDADKLDILKEQCNSIDDNFYNINDELIQNIKDNKLCDNVSCAHDIDHLIRSICFIFDINFNYSLKYIKDNNLLENKFNLLESNNVDIKEIKDIVNKYIEKRIKYVR